MSSSGLQALSSLAPPKPRAPKTARGARAIKARAPKLIENDKKTLLVSGRKTTADIKQLFIELQMFKKPLCHRREYHDLEMSPFEDPGQIERLGRSLDCSLFCFGSHNRKRPNNIVIGRLFDHSLLDAFEFGIHQYLGMRDVPGPKPQPGEKPLLVFHGDLWDHEPRLQILSSLFTDFFQGRRVEKLAHSAVRYAHVFFVSKHGKEGDLDLGAYQVRIRTYLIPTPHELEHSEKMRTLIRGSVGPFSLVPMGPNLDLVTRRYIIASDDDRKAAMRRPKLVEEGERHKVAGAKNLEKDELGRVLGTVYVERPQLEKLGLHKFKGLRRGGEGDSGDDDASERSQGAGTDEMAVKASQADKSNGDEEDEDSNSDELSLQSGEDLSDSLEESRDDTSASGESLEDSSDSEIDLQRSSGVSARERPRRQRK